MGYLGDGKKRPRKGLRPFLQKKIGDLGERWFKKGFNRGHRESHKEFKVNGRVPRKLQYTCNRTLYPGQYREIELESVIKTDKKN